MHATRRAVLAGAGAAALAFPALASGSGIENKRLLVVILRGGMDGLSAVPPIGDPDYRRTRGALAVENALPLDERFALHPNLPKLHEMYGAGELLCIHAAATSYRERSHFDAQNMLETGASAPFARSEGWLNKALGALPGRRGGRGVALAGQAPLVLRGATAVTTWPPSALSDFELQMGGGAIGQLAHAAATLLKQQTGPAAAVLELGGWDTHADQAEPEGALARNLRQLDNALGAFKAEMGALWPHTIVFVATEFGRTVAPNAALGTDHGTASAAFLLGGAVAGGRVLADWPGLSPAALYQRRDLAPTTDLRTVLKGALGDHFALTNAALESAVFPGSERVRPMPGLIRT